MGSDRPTPLGGPDPPCTTRSLPGAVRGSPSHHPAGPRWGAAGRRSSKNRRGLSRAAPAPARSSPRLRSSSPPPNPSRGRTERSPGSEGRPDRRHRCPCYRRPRTRSRLSLSFSRPRPAPAPPSAAPGRRMAGPAQYLITPMVLPLPPRLPSAPTCPARHGPADIEINFCPTPGFTTRPSQRSPAGQQPVLPRLGN